ncbi:hypothetical protein ACTWQB_01285 [Piscibacillus sp. B03]|uniref:hypothetical protein n=1 Tax=Piscibacillus sp. B03 TaxID=3457430 RepID=UPI003FCC5FFA
MWKEAVKLALFEWKVEWFKRVFNQFMMLVALLVLTYATIGSVLADGGLGLDYIYFSVFAFGYAWLVPKEFQYQKVSSQTYASPVFFMLHKLPIQHNTLIKSRFILFYLNAIPVLLLFFIGFYFSPEISDTFTTQGYIAFSLLWFSIGLSFGSIYPASDVGDRNVTNTKLVWITIGLITGITLLITPTYIFYNHGLVVLTIDLANQWPLWVSVISLLIIPIANSYWVYNAKNRLKKEDFEL